MIKQKLLSLGNGAFGENKYWQIRQTINSEGKLGFPGIECHQYKKKLGKDAENVKSMGMCLFCSEMDFRKLQEHHIFGRKNDKIKITLCANCHQVLHWERGRHW